MKHSKLNKGEKNILSSIVKFEKFLIENKINVFTDTYEKDYLELLPFVTKINEKNIWEIFF